jgi:hypothetical protein
MTARIFNRPEATTEILAIALRYGGQTIPPPSCRPHTFIPAVQPTEPFGDRPTTMEDDPRRVGLSVPHRFSNRPPVRHGGRFRHRPPFQTVPAQKPYGNRVGTMGNTMSGASGGTIESGQLPIPTVPRPFGESSRWTVQGAADLATAMLTVSATVSALTLTNCGASNGGNDVGEHLMIGTEGQHCHKPSISGWSRTPVGVLRQLARFRAVPQDRKQHLQSEYQFLPVFVVFNVNEMPGTIRSILGRHIHASNGGEQTRREIVP